MSINRKLLIICGPTATGKTELGIKLAKKFSAQGGSASGGKGEIISADSRQVYKGMDIGTGKDLTKNFKYQISNIKFQKNNIGYYEYNNIKIWGLDIVKPNYQFNMGEYKKLAQQIINNIWQRGKLPIVVGGTGLYIKSLLEPMEYTSIPPNKKLRKILGDYDIMILREKLEKIDKDRLNKMNNSDRNNPRRLIRAIEIATYLKNHPDFHYDTVPYHSNKQNTLIIGLAAPRAILFKRITLRIRKRLRQGIVKEIKKLLQKGYNWNLVSMSGLGYQEFKPYFGNLESLEEVVKKWQIDEQNYAQRQMVWFKKMPQINWFDITEPDFYTRVRKLVCNFLLKP